MNRRDAALARGQEFITADVTQALAGLRKGLHALDRLDREHAKPQSEAAKVETTRKREASKKALVKLRAELDAILLGEDDE